MAQEILRTEDIVECFDAKILASEGHPDIYVVANDTYTSILSKIEQQVGSTSYILAVQHSLTRPSTDNPIVLKDDIPTYYPQKDLGSFLDAVNTFADLPATSSPNDLCPVLDERIIYRWDDDEWQVFIKTGTLDHTQLTSQNADSEYQHLTLVEASILRLQHHSHTNDLSGIEDKGSGLIITTSERGRIPSVAEKSALSGTVGTPSTLNKYVTNLDPRLNTLKNPFATFGQPGTSTTYMGESLYELQEALNTLKDATDDGIAALEVLPGIYKPNEVTYLGLEWDSPSPFMLESLALHAATFRVLSTSDKAFHIKAGEGQVTVRGVHFQLESLASLYIERDSTIFEDCTFTATVAGCTSIIIDAQYVVLRRCIFKDVATAISVNNDYCYIEGCRFIDTNLNVNGSYNKATACSFTGGSINVVSGSYNSFSLNSVTQDTIFTDSGKSTRWLNTTPFSASRVQPYTKRTIGSSSTYADLPDFMLTDPYTTEVEVLPGEYTLDTFEIAEGKTLRGVRNAVTIHADAINLNSFVTLDGLTIIGTIYANDVAGIVLKNCHLTSASFTALTDLLITRCTILGTLTITDCTYTRITHTLFSNAVSTINSDFLYYADNINTTDNLVASGDKCVFRGNHFIKPIPTKVNTVDSLWVGNYPANANNTNGVDVIVIPLTSALRPFATSAASLSFFLGLAAIGFGETGFSVVITPQMFIGELVDRTKGYFVTLKWTSPTFSGDVKWQVSTVFRDREESISDIGDITTVSIISTRTQVSVRREETTTLYFTDYGYIPGVNPTHVSVLIKRLNDDDDDTLSGIAYLTEATITLPRD